MVSTPPLFGATRPEPTHYDADQAVSVQNPRCPECPLGHRAAADGRARGHVLENVPSLASPSTLGPKNQ